MKSNKELLLYKLELGHNATEATKKGATTVTIWFKIFYLSCKNFNNQAKSGRPKTVEPKVMLQVIEVTLLSSTQYQTSSLPHSPE